MATGIAPDAFLDPAMEPGRRRRVLRHVISAMLNIGQEQAAEARSDQYRRELEGRGF